ncbi:hypothetical protein NSZ01_07320 [Nocardioides szechwanensis]|uniref:Uncharacterized protein n=1 Tax=Nocardioides szechwanensis TaxID=1005944 RepID=A0A1G9VD09_9ACTN|nr:hypothetical protein NSZ01_07320 [Nocardioides szechwanensis]SDM69956.1 hypothetical protein SAMN05192576_0726 [Nocardioides szechwanensis]
MGLAPWRVGQSPAVLNDLSRQTRTMLFFQMLGSGLMFGALFAILDEHLRLALALAVTGLVVTLGWAIGVTVWNRRVDRAFKTMLVRAAEEVVTGKVAGIPAVGRVHRRRIARREPAFLADTSSALPGPSVVLVVTALAEGGARRVGALVPALVGLEARKAPVALLLHPHEREAAVLDNRVTLEQVAAIGDDPRWDTEWLPTDRTVVGGYLPVVGFAVLGLVVGVGLDLALVRLAT